MSHQGTLDGRAVLVTGASSGIGRAIALAVANAGADVALTYRTNADGAGAVRDAIVALGRKAEIFQLDLARDGEAERVGRAARAALGRLNVWINNAGADILTGPGATLSDVDKLALLLTVDLRGTILASWAAAALLSEDERGGVILNMSWDHVLTGMPGRNPEMFAAVKGGVLAFSKALARSVAPRVRVNILAPGWIETAFGSTLDEERRTKVAASTPLARWGTPEDVAAAAVFLASDAASFMTGQALLVGGGVVM